MVYANDLGVETSTGDEEFANGSLQTASSGSTIVLVGIIVGAVVVAAGI